MSEEVQKEIEERKKLEKEMMERIQALENELKKKKDEVETEKTERMVDSRIYQQEMESQVHK